MRERKQRKTEQKKQTNVEKTDKDTELDRTKNSLMKRQTDGQGNRARQNEKQSYEQRDRHTDKETELDSAKKKTSLTNRETDIRTRKPSWTER